jgi:hypothetical protein
MGFLEAAVVVYLRELYYPNGFAFPLVVLGPKVGIVEILREAATLVMLLSIAFLTGHNNRQRFAYFLIAFAVWDSFYYIFLKLFLDWPASFLTWDILFLIPAPWVGPVLSPLIACTTMLVLAWIILRNEIQGITRRLEWVHWLLLVVGSLVIVGVWMWDYISLSGGLSASPEQALAVLSTHVPSTFNWWAFSAGEGLILAGIVLYAKGTNSSRAGGETIFASTPAAESSPGRPVSASHSTRTASRRD